MSHQGPEFGAAIEAAQIRHEDGDSQGVVDCLGDFTHMRPAEPEFYVLLANAYRSLNRVKNAKDVLAIASEVCPTPELHILDGKLHRDLGDHDGAIEAYDKAIGLDEECAEAYCQKGIVLEILGKMSEAERSFNTALSIDPGNGMYWLCASKIDQSSNNPEAALRKLTMAKIALHNRRTPNHHYNMACIESILGNLDEAMDHFASFLEEHPFAFGWAEQDPDLNNTRSHPRMAELRKEFAPAEV